MENLRKFRENVLNGRSFGSCLLVTTPSPNKERVKFCAIQQAGIVVAKARVVGAVIDCSRQPNSTLSPCDDGQTERTKFGLSTRAQAATI